MGDESYPVIGIIQIMTSIPVEFNNKKILGMSLVLATFLPFF